MPQKLQGKKVLITGGAGFIGSNLCEEMLACDNQVVCFDNFATGKRENTEPFLTDPAFTLIEADIRDYAAIKAAMAGCDIVLHQAALGSVPRSINDPLTTNEVNITGFLNIMQAARELEIKRVVYAASSSTYGDSKALPKREEVIGLPLSPYAVTKYVNELYAKVYGDLFGVETIGLRYFNVFGKRQTPDGAYAAAIPKFIRAFTEYRSPVLHGDGRQTRDFTYIANVLQMNHLAAVTENREAVNKVYNTACGDRTDLLSLVDIIREALVPFDPAIGGVEVEFGPPREGDVRDSLADISRAEELLGYRPTHKLREGIREAIDWYWANLKGG